MSVCVGRPRLQFHEMLPADVNYGPDVVLQVWDRATQGKGASMILHLESLSHHTGVKKNASTLGEILKRGERVPRARGTTSGRLRRDTSEL